MNPRLIPVIFLFVLLTTCVALLCQPAHPAELPAPPKPAPTYNTVGVLIFEVDGIPQYVIFIDDNGMVGEAEYRACVQTPTCVKRLQTQIDAGHVDQFNVLTKVPDTKT
jgi:hypothetical protein